MNKSAEVYATNFVRAYMVVFRILTNRMTDDVTILTGIGRSQVEVIDTPASE